MILTPSSLPPEFIKHKAEIGTAFYDMMEVNRLRQLQCGFVYADSRWFWSSIASGNKFRNGKPEKTLIDAVKDYLLAHEIAGKVIDPPAWDASRKYAENVSRTMATRLVNEWEQYEVSRKSNDEHVPVPELVAAHVVLFGTHFGTLVYECYRRLYRRTD